MSSSAAAGGDGESSSSSSSTTALKCHTDIYGGVLVKSAENEHLGGQSGAQLRAIADAECERWRLQRVRGVWLHIRLQHAHWIQVWAERGFDFHHAKPGYVMMTKWLSPNEPSCLPVYPFTTIGVGGITLSRDGRLLLMREKRGVYLGWKFPGGLNDPGETLFETVNREVKEETGVDVEGDYVVMFRQSPKGYKWSCDDFYFLVVCRPKNGGSSEDNPVTVCPHEASDVRWMTRPQVDALPADEFPSLLRSVLRKVDAHERGAVDNQTTIRPLTYHRRAQAGMAARTFYVYSVGNIDDSGDPPPDKSNI